MILLAFDFTNLHQAMQSLYTDMIPLCSDLIGVAKAVAGIGALFYVAARVWEALSKAEAIDVYPLLRPFAIGMCIMFFPTIVLGTINVVLSPVVKGCHYIMENQIMNMGDLKEQKEQLEYEALLRDPETKYMVDNAEYEKRLLMCFITSDMQSMYSMWKERSWYKVKKWLNDALIWLLELIFHGAALLIDVLRTFILIVLSILGPIAFAISVYSGFHSTLSQWITRYISVYLWLPVADLFSAVLARIQCLTYTKDINMLQDPNFIPDTGGGVYILFLFIGIIGYFCIPSITSWIIQSDGAGSFGNNINRVTNMGAAASGAVAGNITGKLMHHK